jgi:hypothetical protein
VGGGGGYEDAVHGLRTQTSVADFIFIFQFSQVGGMAIIHKRNAPHLATGQTSKVNILKDSCLVLATGRNSLFKYGDMLLVFPHYMANFSVFFFFSKKFPFTIRTEFFLVATTRKFATKFLKEYWSVAYHARAELLSSVACLRVSCGEAASCERATQYKERKKRTGQRIESKEKRGEEITTTTTIRKNTL